MQKGGGLREVEEPQVTKVSGRREMRKVKQYVGVEINVLYINDSTELTVLFLVRTL